MEFVPEWRSNLEVLVARHSFVGELGQEHGNEDWQAPLGSEPVGADPRQPQDVLGDVWGFALQHSAPAQTQGGRRQATETGGEGQTHAGEEASPSGHVLVLLRPLQREPESRNSGYVPIESGTTFFQPQQPFHLRVDFWCHRTFTTPQRSLTPH